MIVSELMGGMGNQMFQYALGRQLSIINNTDLILDVDFLLDRTPKTNFVHRDYNLNIFNISQNFAPPGISKNYGSRRSLTRRAFQKIWKPSPLVRILEKDVSFNPRVLHSPDNVYLHGFWQSEKYFKNIESIIRSDFTFKTGIRDDVKKDAFLISGSNSICLHVRRGDFVNNPMHGTLSMEYYGKAESYIKKRIKDPSVFVFSDDMNWCKQNIRLSIQTHYVEDDVVGEGNSNHFRLMANCKHFIICNSSFSWWAAWLSSNEGKIIIAPKNWTINNAHYDIYPDNWIKI